VNNLIVKLSRAVYYRVSVELITWRHVRLPMAHNDQPAIQNSTGICFYCNGKLVDVAPIESWAVKSEEISIKVKCSNPKCQATAWKLNQGDNLKENMSDGKNSALRLDSASVDGRVTPGTRSA
jgi:uncharacterized protein with PIN domain